MPNVNSFDMQFGRSTTPVVLLSAFQSVENVSGQNPAFRILSTTSQRRWPTRPKPTSNHTPRRRAASTAGRILPASSTIAFGGGANRCVTMSPGFSRSSNCGNGDSVWPMWIMTGNPNAVATSCARFNVSTSFAVTPFESRALMPTIKSRCAAMAARSAPTSARARSIVSPSGRMPPRPTLISNAALLRRRARNLDPYVDAVGAVRAGVDPARHAVGEHHARPLERARRVRVDVDEPRHDELAARVDRAGRGRGDAGLYRGDAALHDA